MGLLTMGGLRGLLSRRGGGKARFIRVSRLLCNLGTQTRSCPSGRARLIASFWIIVNLLIEFGSMPMAA